MTHRQDWAGGQVSLAALSCGTGSRQASAVAVIPATLVRPAYVGVGVSPGRWQTDEGGRAGGAVAVVGEEAFHGRDALRGLDHGE
jgi:hypothetical protein